jgi:hypothetical protein
MSERRGKYNAKRTTQDGVTFDSLAEARRYDELKLMEAAGEIWNLKCQPHYLLQEDFDHDGKHERKIEYIADFTYFDRTLKCTVVEDCKGFATEVYKIKRKIFLKRYPNLKFIEVEA